MRLQCPEVLKQTSKSVTKLSYKTPTFSSNCSAFTVKYEMLLMRVINCHKVPITSLDQWKMEHWARELLLHLNIMDEDVRRFSS